MDEKDVAEPDLLPRIAAGDPEAIARCLERYGPLVWSLAKRLSKDVAALDDVVQEIFIDVWKSAGRYDPSKASEATFLATIARRRVIDRRRRDARHADAEDIDEAAPGVADPGLERVDVEDEAALARRALSRLAPQRRQLILMSVVDGLSHQEIAAATGLPLGTVKSHIRRGLDEAAQALRGPSPAKEGA